ncbi:MAG: ABC transporter permease subunit [Clostridium sp.]|uniref:ABC transporter permease subunit n=1 Tax=Clostridium sp. TaxID=1506 RepID=UPI00301FB054
MLRLVKAEMYKMFKSRLFKVLCGVAIALSMVCIGFTQMMNEDFMKSTLGDMPEEQKEQMIQEVQNMGASDAIVTPGKLGFTTTGAKDQFNITPEELFHVSFGSGIIEILFVILVAGLCAKEYSQGTIKNTLAYGKKREEFYISKFIAITAGTAIIMALMTSISTIVRVILYSGPVPLTISQLSGMLGVFAGALVVNASIVALVMVFATLIKSNGATIGLGSVIFLIVPTIAGFLYGNYDWFDKIYELTPFYNTALATSINATSSDVMTAAMVGGITCILALGVGIAIFKKQDIK